MRIWIVSFIIYNSRHGSALFIFSLLTRRVINWGLREDVKVHRKIGFSYLWQCLLNNSQYSLNLKYSTKYPFKWYSIIPDNMWNICLDLWTVPDISVNVVDGLQEQRDLPQHHLRGWRGSPPSGLFLPGRLRLSGPQCRHHRGPRDCPGHSSLLLYCTVLYCTVLYCTVLTVLYCTV